MTDKNIISIFQKLEQRRQQEEAIAYFSRHGTKDGTLHKVMLLPGLSIVRNKDGIWLDFGEVGEGCMVHFDMMGPQGHKDSPVQKAIDAWCKDFVERDDADIH